MIIVELLSMILFANTKKPSSLDLKCRLTNKVRYHLQGFSGLRPC